VECMLSILPNIKRPTYHDGSQIRAGWDFSRKGRQKNWDTMSVATAVVREAFIVLCDVEYDQLEQIVREVFTRELLQRFLSTVSKLADKFGNGEATVSACVEEEAIDGCRLCGTPGCLRFDFHDGPCTNERLVAGRKRTRRCVQHYVAKPAPPPYLAHRAAALASGLAPSEAADRTLEQPTVAMVATGTAAVGDSALERAAATTTEVAAMRTAAVEAAPEAAHRRHLRPEHAARPVGELTAAQARPRRPRAMSGIQRYVAKPAPSPYLAHRAAALASGLAPSEAADRTLEQPTLAMVTAARVTRRRAVELEVTELTTDDVVAMRQAREQDEAMQLQAHAEVAAKQEAERRSKRIKLYNRKESRKRCDGNPDLFMCPRCYYPNYYPVDEHTCNKLPCGMCSTIFCIACGKKASASCRCISAAWTRFSNRGMHVS
jgi:hypothetical protein